VPYIEGTVSKFANTVITVVEVIGTGDGIQTVFNFTVLNAPAFLDSLQGSYVIGTTTFNFTSDTSGNITGTNINSGTFDGTDGTITFSTAPDNGTDVELTQYTAKGFIQVLKEYVTNENENTTNIYEETIGTGDGVQTVFNFSLSNFPMARGQIRIEYTYQGTKYYIYDDGAGNWEREQITSSTITYADGTGGNLTFNVPPDNLTDIKAFYTTSAIEGRDWLLLLDQNTKDNNNVDAFPGTLLQEIVLKNSGISYKESVADGGICFGFREVQDTGNDTYNFQMNLYKQWLDAEQNTNDWAINLADTGFIYNTVNETWRNGPYTPIDNEPMQYFIIATKNAIRAAIRCAGTVYTSFYCGAVFRKSSPLKYPKPYFIIGNINDLTAFTSTSGNLKYIADVTQESGGFNQGFSFYIRPDGTYKNDCRYETLPKTEISNTGISKGTPDGKVASRPITLLEIDTNQVLGDLEGVKVCLDNRIAAENTVEDQNLEEFVVIPNIFRTTFSDYMLFSKDL